MEANSKKLRYILIAAIVIVVAFIGARKVRKSWHWGSRDPGEWISVLVAERYIPAFTVIKSDLVRIQEFPKGLVPPGAFRAKSELENPNGQKLFTAAISIPEGQPVTRAFLTDASQNDTLGSILRPGKVAVSFEIDRSHGVGGWIKPGDTVALFGATPMTISGSRALGKKTRLLFPSVAVIAVDSQRLGQNLEKITENGADPIGVSEALTSGGDKILTVLVTPTEATALIEAREEGNISVVLRSLGDDIPWPPAN